jgi:ATPase subunit of ABC transporter with duplicated ATPase domains
MLAGHEVTRHHGARVVLERVSLVVPPRARVGVVGPNGVGKSTLLRILAGLEEPDAGRVTRTPPTLRVGYLPQESDVQPGETLHDYLSRRTRVVEAEATMDELAARLETEPALAAAYGDALETFLAFGGDDLEQRARAVCAEVGLEPARLHDPVGTLSGGQAARAALAAILLARFDVLLLDEPTNDLDFAGLELLERFVTTTPAAVVVVSHDREFLDRTISRVVELDEWTARATEYAGGWSAYAAERERARRAQYEAFDQYVGEKERLQEQMRRMREWEQRGYGQGRKKKKTKDVRGAFERRVDRLEKVEKPYEPWELRLKLGAGERAGDVVARLDAAVIERGTFRLGPIDLDVGWRDRLALVGPNGSGKTTLLLALLGRLPLGGGSRTIGSAVVLGELEQDRETFVGEQSLLDAFRDVTATKPEEARTLLAKFGLGAEDVLRPCSSLSPGERTRATLAAFAARGVNVLVLDEPTNHLDLAAIEELERALAAFEGTIVAVSHDRRFLERLAPTRVFDLSAARAERAGAGC